MSKIKFRLALRAEGEFWNAYLADMHTMKGAVLLGSLRMSVAANNKQLKSQFMSLMQRVISHAAHEVMGEEIKEWEKPRAAPESE